MSPASSGTNEPGDYKKYVANSFLPIRVRLQARGLQLILHGGGHGAADVSLCAHRALSTMEIKVLLLAPAHGTVELLLTLLGATTTAVRDGYVSERGREGFVPFPTIGETVAGVINRVPDVSDMRYDVLSQ